MREILLLGCFHFQESGLDVFAPGFQKELEELAGRLAEFAPDALALEAAAHQQWVLEEAYGRFRLEDLEDPEKMRTQTLGTIHVFGRDVPMNYGNETVQIGFRLGKLLDLPKVWAVDDDSEIDGAPFENPAPETAAAMGEFGEYAGARELEGLLGKLRFCGGPEWVRRNHAIYVRANQTGAGTRAVAQWYARNLKIFSNIQRLAQENERVFELYGSGHLHILRRLIQEDGRFRLVDGLDFLGNSDDTAVNF